MVESELVGEGELVGDLRPGLARLAQEQAEPGLEGHDLLRDTTPGRAVPGGPVWLPGADASEPPRRVRVLSDLSADPPYHPPRPRVGRETPGHWQPFIVRTSESIPT
jgi:hypothetical protein